MDIGSIQFTPQYPRGISVFLEGHKFKCLGRLSNGWTDWHQMWHTCAYSSGNRYTPNKLLFETQGWHLGVLGGQTFKSLDRLAPTLFHVCGFIWEWTYAKYKPPHNTTGGILGGFRGHKSKSPGKLSNCSTDCHQIWYVSADSFGNGHS